MKKTDFVKLLQRKLEIASKKGEEIFPTGISRSQAGCIVDNVFESIIEVVGAGGEVRLKYGAFHPKVVQSDGKVINVKLGFRSFVATNRDLFEEFSDNDMGLQVGKFSEVFCTKGSSRVLDDKGRELLSMTEVSSRSGVSLPTCYRYVKEPWFGQVAEEMELVHEGNSGKRYSPAVVDIFKHKKAENEARVKGEIELRKEDGGREYAISISAMSRKTGIPTSTLYGLIKRIGIRKMKHPNLPDGRDFYSKEDMETIKEFS